ncbi:MAG: hypothetical protein B7733_13185 [Myxococcales bacterium FL481]|nr:MAG: hypothetical protein B7733_13185 [Myxococcales bacterium FL481]
MARRMIRWGFAPLAASGCLLEPITVGRVGHSASDTGLALQSSDPSGASTDVSSESTAIPGEDTDAATGSDDGSDTDQDASDSATADGLDVDGVYRGMLRMRVRNSMAGLSDFCEVDGIEVTVEQGMVVPTIDQVCTFAFAPWTDTFVSWWPDGPVDPESGEVTGEVLVEGPAWSASDAWQGYFGPGQFSGDFQAQFDNAGWTYELQGFFFLE